MSRSANDFSLDSFLTAREDDIDYDERIIECLDRNDKQIKLLTSNLDKLTISESTNVKFTIGSENESRSINE